MNTALPGTAASMAGMTASPLGLALDGGPYAAAVVATSAPHGRGRADAGTGWTGLSLLPEVAPHGTGLSFAAADSTDDITGLPPRAAPV